VDTVTLGSKPVMRTPGSLLRAADRMQQSHPWLAFPLAVWKKFGDDQAGNLAALLAYYTFIAIFPLLLVLITLLDIAVSHDPALRQQVLNSALRAYPVIGPQLQDSVRSPHQTGVALVIGLAGSLLGARGVAGAAQDALNTVWEIPLSRRPAFPWSMLRGAGLVLAVGAGEIVTAALSGIVFGHLVTGVAGRAGAIALSLALNIGLFWLAFRLATASDVSWRDLRLGAVASAIAWQLLQLFGGFVVGRLLQHSSALYGIFGVVLGLLAWLYLQAQITLYAAEAATVQAWHLWPRSLFPPPLTEQDRRAYRLYGQVTRRPPPN
jgi:membrane protein